MLEVFLLTIQIILAIGLIALVLLQPAKGTEVGSAFGSGASQTLFGSQGSNSFIFKLTFLCAALFFINSLCLNYQVARQTQRSDPIEQLAKMAKHPQLTQVNSSDKKEAQPHALIKKESKLHKKTSD